MEYMLTRLEWLVGPDKIQTLKDTSSHSLVSVALVVVPLRR